jgi:hypothetical protein
MFVFVFRLWLVPVRKLVMLLIDSFMDLLIYVQKKGARCGEQRKAAGTSKKPRVSQSFPFPTDAASNAVLY